MATSTDKARTDIKEKFGDNIDDALLDECERCGLFAKACHSQVTMFRR